VRSARQQSSRAEQNQRYASGAHFRTATVAVGALAFGAWCIDERRQRSPVALAADTPKVDWDQLRADIVAVLDNPKYDDGTFMLCVFSFFEIREISISFHIAYYHSQRFQNPTNNNNNIVTK
jgi:hypothetical protein